MYDISGKVLSYSNSSGDEEIWKQLLHEGNLIAEYTKITEDAGVFEKLLNSDEPLISKLPFSPYRMMGCRAEGGDVKGLVMMAGSPYRIEDIMVRQFKQAEGDNPIINGIVRLERKVYAGRLDGLCRMSDEEAKKKKFAGNTSLYYFKEMGQRQQLTTCLRPASLC